MPFSNFLEKSNAHTFFAVFLKKRARVIFSKKSENGNNAHTFFLENDDFGYAFNWERPSKKLILTHNLCKNAFLEPAKNGQNGQKWAKKLI